MFALKYLLNYYFLFFLTIQKNIYTIILFFTFLYLNLNFVTNYLRMQSSPTQTMGTKVDLLGPLDFVRFLAPLVVALAYKLFWSAPTNKLNRAATTKLKRGAKQKMTKILKMGLPSMHI